MTSIAVKNYKGIEVNQIKTSANPDAAERLLENAILDKVLEANHIEVPQERVDQEVSMMILEMNHKMKYEGLATGVMISLTQDEMKERIETFKEEAFKLVKTELILKAIIEAENITVSTAELEEEAKTIALRQKVSIEMVKDFLGETLGSLQNDLLVRKAITFLKNTAVII